MDFVCSESPEIDAFLEELSEGLAVPQELWPLRHAARELRHGKEDTVLATWLLHIRWRSLLWPVTAPRKHGERQSRWLRSGDFMRFR